MPEHPDTPSPPSRDWFERLNRLARWLNPPGHEVSDDEMIDPGRYIRDDAGRVTAPGKSGPIRPGGSVTKK